MRCNVGKAIVAGFGYQLDERSKEDAEHHIWLMEWEATEDLSRVQAKEKTMSQRDGAMLHRISILKHWVAEGELLSKVINTTQEQLQTMVMTSVVGILTLMLLWFIETEVLWVYRLEF